MAESIRLPEDVPQFLNESDFNYFPFLLMTPEETRLDFSKTTNNHSTAWAKAIFDSWNDSRGKGKCPDSLLRTAESQLRWENVQSSLLPRAIVINN